MGKINHYAILNIVIIIFFCLLLKRCFKFLLIEEKKNLKQFNKFLFKFSTLALITQQQQQQTFYFTLPPKKIYCFKLKIIKK